MQYGPNIFQQDLNVATALLSVLLLIFSIGLYHSLFQNVLKKHMEGIFFATKDFKLNANRSFIYLFLTSVPMLLLSIISFFYNNSFIGLQISMSLDQLNILIISGYIYWIEESRHTPIRGLHLIRDILFAVTAISLLMNIFYKGSISLDYPIALIVLLVVYYFTIVHFQGVQQLLMKILGLKELNSYNSKFLLTSKHQIADFLEIKDIITQKSELIQQQLDDYREILVNLQENQEDQEILMNFAKLFLPIKKAYQIKEQSDNNQVLNQIEQDWESGSVSSNQEEQHEGQNMYKSPTWNQSTDGLGFYLKHTYTDDFVNQNDVVKELSLYKKILKYIYYPIHLSSLAQGRLFILAGFIGCALLAGSMFCISNSSSYLSYHLNSISIISILVSIPLTYPTANYCIQISFNNDYDFTNMFIQCMILKLGLVGLFLVGYNLFFKDTMSIDHGAFIVLIVRMSLLVVYLAFMVLNRFATRSSNFKYFCGFVIVSQIAKVLTENFYNTIEG